MPQYVQADPDERRAIRELYWRACVEERVPLAQRESAYRRFVRDWEIAESGGSQAPTRTTSLSPYMREQQPAVPSPVSRETMLEWCKG